MSRCVNVVCPCVSLRVVVLMYDSCVGVSECIDVVMMRAMMC